MRTIFLATVTIATLSLTGAARAGSSLVRALRPDGGTNCGFYTIEQCRDGDFRARRILRAQPVRSRPAGAIGATSSRARPHAATRARTSQLARSSSETSRYL